MQSPAQLKISREFWHWALDDTTVQSLLDDLEIDESDWPFIFDALDYNCDGYLEMVELIDGLALIRGKARGMTVAQLHASVKAVDGKVRVVGEVVGRLVEALGYDASGKLEKCD